MSPRYTLAAIIHPALGGGAYVEVPFEVEAAFGDKCPQVKASMEGETFVTRLARMGTPCHVVGVPKDLREIGEELRRRDSSDRRAR